ncbi:MAG: TolC family protein [Bacteroidaceae bacterium]|nr:TolC family protein [Bacteroidaceae bacterium]
MKKSFFALGIALSTALSCPAQQVWTLQQCIDYATEHNINIQQQKQNVVQQEIALNTSRNSRLPSLQASASQTFNFGRGLTAENTYANRNTMNTGLDMSANVPIYTGGQITHDINMKRLGLDAALADVSKARESLSIQVTSAYLEVLYQKELWLIAGRQLELSENQLERIHRLYESGKAAEAEYAEAQSVVASDQLQLTQRHNSYQLALLDLSQLLELPSPEHFEIESPEMGSADETVLDIPDAIYQQAVALRPRIKSEEIRMKSAEENISLAKSAKLPKLTAMGGLGSNYYKVSGYKSSSFGRQLKDNFNQYIGVSLSIPIFNRYANRNQIRTAKAQYTVQQLQLDQAKKDLYKEIQQAYYNALAAQNQCKSSETAQRASETAFRLMEKKYENGKANATEYQESRTKLQKAQSDWAQARYSFFFLKKILDFYQGEAL